MFTSPDETRIVGKSSKKRPADFEVEQTTVVEYYNWLTTSLLIYFTKHSHIYQRYVSLLWPSEMRLIPCWRHSEVSRCVFFLWSFCLCTSPFIGSLWWCHNVYPTLCNLYAVRIHQFYCIYKSIFQYISISLRIN